MYSKTLIKINDVEVVYIMEESKDDEEYINRQVSPRHSASVINDAGDVPVKKSRHEKERVRNYTRYYKQNKI